MDIRTTSGESQCHGEFHYDQSYRWCFIRLMGDGVFNWRSAFFW
jgi:hypothetical protein